LRANKSVDIAFTALIIRIRFSSPMLTPLPTASALTNGGAAILQFPSGPAGSVRSLKNMTAQLLQDATKVIPNQQLLINVVSKRVRQLGIGHRPLVEATLKSSLTDIALQEIIAGKLTFEETPATPAKA
jgi:DNA-directed RNA polymerase subunit omega